MPKISTRATECTDTNQFKTAAQTADKTLLTIGDERIGTSTASQRQGIAAAGIAIGARHRVAANLMRELVGMAIAPIVRMITTHNHVDDPRTYAIIGAAIEVHRVMGTGFSNCFTRML